MAKKRLSTVTRVTSAGNNDYIVMSASDGKTVQIKKTDFINSITALLPFTGSALKNRTLGKRGWYRILIGGNLNNISSGIINLGNLYNSNYPGSVCFYFWGSGYTNGFAGINLIGKCENIFTKIRILYKASTAEKLFVDVFYNVTTTNNVYLSLSNSLNVNVYNMDFVEEDEIPEGYAVKEFGL